MTKAFKVMRSEKHDQDLIEHDAVQAKRLNKFVSDSGYCSRRQADRHILAGDVFINGEPAVLGNKVHPNDKVEVCGTVIQDIQEKVYIALHKPVGITCTTDPEVEGNIADFMQYKDPIFPIGRLDKDSSGLLLMTNDGDVVNKILREEHGHDKEYEVKVNKELTNEFLNDLEAGVEIYNPVAHELQTTEPCTVIQTAGFKYTIIIRQGLNRQIRRMAKALGYQVVGLKRTRIMNIDLGTLPVGSWRYLTNEELIDMNRSLQENVYD